MDKNKSFDDIIKDKLNSYTPLPKMESWDTFNQKLIKENQLYSLEEEIGFDAHISEKLDEIRPQPLLQNWELLRYKLETIELYKTKIYISKMIEIAGIFLIVFTFINLFPQFNNNKPENSQQIHFAYNDHSVLKKNEIGETTKFNNQKFYENIALRDDKANARNLPEENKTNSQEVDRYQTRKLNVELLPHYVPLVQSTDAFITNLNLIKDIIITENMDFVGSTTKFQEFETTDLALLPLIETNPQSEYAAIFPIEFSMIKSALESKYRISIFGTSDMNMINTPFDRVYSKAAYNREALGNSWGFGIAKKVNHFEIETGVNFSNRTYHPEVVQEEFGILSEIFYETSLEKISFDVVQLPINSKYHLIDKSAWGLYFLAGAALNLVVNAEYDIKTNIKQGRPSSRFVEETPRLDEKKFNAGLFNDGDFKENYFATLAFGFGIETKLIKNLDFYMQPTYQRHMLSSGIGIGPNEDKIHTASLQIGLKYALN